VAAGQLLEDVLAAPDLDVEKVMAVGTALAELHAQRAEKLSLLTHAAEINALFEVARGISHYDPHLARRAHALAQHLSGLIADSPRLDFSLHGDFYAAQVLLTGDRVAFIDLDQARRGDPAIDLGTFIAHLEYDAVLGTLDPGRVEPVKAALLRGYQAVTRELMPNQLQLYTAARLFQLSPHPFRQRASDWPEMIEAIFERVSGLLEPLNAGAIVGLPGGYAAGIRQEPAVEVSDPLGAAADQQMPFLPQALSPSHMQSLLADNLPRLPGFSAQILLQAIRVTRHKPGRRCVVEYDVQMQPPGTLPETFTLVGKIHARNLKRSVFKVLESLWMAGFRADSQDGISIPEPVGMIAEFHMLLQRKVAGRAATRLLSGAQGIELAGRLAEAAHKIHRAGIRTHRRHTINDEMKILSERIQSVAQAKPEWSDRMARLSAGCYRLASAIPDAPVCGIHRDFYPDQVLVDGARLYLLDFDLYCAGDPALDIGNFVGHIQEFSLRKTGSASSLADREAAVIERYIELNASIRGAADLRRAVSIYTTLTLARHISISSQFPARQPFTGELLELCEQRLGLALRPYDRQQPAARRPVV
jgi:Ser/Thr protein kinase RdoA (MazF antagonist)